MTNAFVPAALLASLLGTDPGTTPTEPLFRVHSDLPGMTYVNVSGSPDQLPILEQNGQGLGMIDFDDDGWVDLFVPNGSTETRWKRGDNPGCRLYRNLGGWRFLDVTDQAGLRDRDWGCGVAVADYDADGDFDVYTLNWGRNRLYRNDGKGRFVEIAATAGISDPRWSSSAAFADFNGDGHLDLYVSNYVQFSFNDYPTREKDGGACLYRGLPTGCGPWCYDGQRDSLFIQAGTGRFVDRSPSAGLNATVGFRGFGVIADDLDGDGDVDVFIGCDVMPNLRLENDGTGRFTSVGGGKGGAFNADGKHESGMGVAASDFDRDGHLDLFVTNFSGETNTFYRNHSGMLSDRTSTIGFGLHPSEMGWGVIVRDFNQDGRPDVFVANGHIYPQVNRLDDPNERYEQPPRLYLQEKDGRLREVGTVAAFHSPLRASLRGCAAVDLDNDGDWDIVAMQHNGPLLFFENTSNKDALSIELVDVGGGRSPMGTRVSVDGVPAFRLLPNQGYQSSHDHRILIPLTKPNAEVSIEVTWPNGTRQRHALPPRPTGTFQIRQGSLSVRYRPPNKPDHGN